MNKKMPYRAPLFSLGVLVCCLLLNAQNASAQIDNTLSNISVDQVDFVEPVVLIDSDRGLFTVTYTPDPTNVLFLNVMALNYNNDQTAWIIRNVPLPPFSSQQTISCWFPLNALGIQNGTDLTQVGIAAITPTFIISNPPPVNNWQPFNVGTQPYVIGNGTVGTLGAPITIEPLTAPIFSPTAKVTYIYRGCTIPNIDLDSSKNYPGSVAGYAGDKNACGPAGAANSLEWLEQTHPKIPVSSTHREKLEELSAFMKRANNSGVITSDFIEAKVAFIDKHKLPIHVKFQSFKMGTDGIPSPDTTYKHSARNANDSASAPPNWNWLMGEMEHGEDVELEFGYYDTAGVRQGGHWVTVTGVSDVGTARGIYFKDDLRQDSAGGTRQQYVNWDTTSKGWPFLAGISGPEYRCFVESVVSESYDPGVRYDIIEPAFERIHFVEPVHFPNSYQGLYSFTYFPHDSLRFMNVVARIPDDTTSLWLVRNLPLPPFEVPQRLSYWADILPFRSLLDNPTFNPFLDVYVYVDFQPVKQAPPVDPEDLFRIPITDFRYIVGDGTVGNDAVSQPFQLPHLPTFEDITVKEWIYRGCTVPNIDLDSSKNAPSSVAGYAGDKNACGPAGAANSLQWLEETNPKIPKAGTHREKLQELSKLMKRANNGGVVTKDFIEAKLAFIDKHKLPIHVKFQSFKFDTTSIISPDTTNGGGFGHKANNRNDSAKAPPTFAWLASEMKKGEDVELEFGYYDNTGRRRGGHWVTITGVSDVGTARGLYFKDDLRQDSAGGTRQQYANWELTSTGWPYLTGVSSPTYRCFVESVVSESYDPSIRHDIVNISLDEIQFSEPFIVPNSEQYTFSFTQMPTTELQFMNVGARKVGDTTAQPLWILQNIPLIPRSTPQMLAYPMEELPLFNTLIVDNTIDIEVNVTNTIQPAPPNTKEVSTIRIGDITYHVPDGGPQAQTGPEKLTIPGPVVWNTSLTTDTIYRGCTVPNIDLDSMRHNPGNSAGYAGDKNACGPAAAANSLQWLANVHAQIDSTRNHRDMMEELSKLMARQNERGVSTTQLARGKLAYIDKYMLPIRVKFQSRWHAKDAGIASPDTNYRHSARNDNPRDNAPPTWEWLWNEVDHGEDVELLFGWYDSTGTRRGGHWVTITGMINNGDSARRIWVKDDWNQRDTGGTRQQLVGWDTAAGGVPILTGWSNTRRQLRVEAAVSESYDSTITFVPVIQGPTLLGPTLGQMEFVEPFPSGGGNIAVFTTRVAQGDLPGIMQGVAQIPGTEDVVWLIPNLIMTDQQASDPISFWADLGLLGISTTTPPDSLRMAFIMTDAPWITLQEREWNWQMLPIQQQPYIVGNGVEDLHTGPFGPFRLPPPPIFTTPATVDSVFRGCQIPNIELDSMRNNPTSISGYAGDKNACGPAAAANSLHWMERTFEKIDSTTTHRQKLEELSKLMQRTNNEGVLTRDFIRGKLAFIDKYKLPIKVKFQTRWLGTDSVPSPDTTSGKGYGHSARNRNDSANANPTWEFMKQEVKDEEDVEMIVQWIDSLGNNAGAHVITITGYSNAAGAKRFWYKDDQNQRDTGGLSHTQVTWDTAANGRPIIREMGMHDTLCYITGVISESYDSTVAFTISDAPSGPVIERGGLSLSVIRNPSSRNESVEMHFTLPERSSTDVVLYDLLGRELRRFAEGPREAGPHSIVWDGRDETGARMPSGTYLLVVRTEKREATIRVIRQ